MHQKGSATEGVTRAVGKTLGKGSASAGLFVPLCWGVDEGPPFGDPCLGAQAGEQWKPAALGLSPSHPPLAQPHLLHHHSQAATQTCSASLVASKALALGPSSLVSKPFPALQSQSQAVPRARDSWIDPISAHPDLPKPAHSLGSGFP